MSLIYLDPPIAPPKNGENEYILILWGKKDTILNGANGGSSYICIYIHIHMIWPVADPHCECRIGEPCIRTCYNLFFFRI